MTPVKHCFCSGPRGHEKRDVLRFASLIAASSKVRFDLICAEHDHGWDRESVTRESHEGDHY